MSRRGQSYDLDQCALYRCGSKRKLFKLLQTSPAKYAELRAAPDLYRRMSKPKKNGGTREILAPRHDLKRIQKRVSELLMRVKAPDFLMSPVRGRSNIDNAAAHRGATSHRLLDIEDFYPNCLASKVAWFFGTVMGCPPDVVAVLTWLTTWQGALPQGSPASPILAYLAYRDMWHEVDARAREAGNRLTVYVDDVTVSGDVVRSETIWSIKQILFRHGHRTKDAKEETRFGTPVIVTGAVLRDGQMLLPNVQHQKRHRVRKALERMPEGPQRVHAQAVLEGYDEGERQILSRNRRPNPRQRDP
ncbi:reverse transcriptase family protein [Jannaschia sp. W003]|uniref:reverse transcriptase family protein n=1 Tax=Jannaschia sp. W003 TaxID=2867012 RepID=UPI0021A72A78|nr:reverse transcriptase family protein [Jannaschia sp. W003]UWQ20118.1 reverse transcriptase family protein [Jannaschia sp. W003]